MRRPLKLWFYIAIGAGRILLTAFLLLFDRGGRLSASQRGTDEGSKTAID
jgi:hypothetical protein